MTGLSGILQNSDDRIVLSPKASIRLEEMKAVSGGARKRESTRKDSEILNKISLHRGLLTAIPPTGQSPGKRQTPRIEI
jgi:hypothetical protein